MVMSGPLFGSAVTGPGSTHGAKHLVEMKAGRMILKGSMVYPDKRKGMLYVYQSDDSLMHFCWKDRTTGMVEDDLIIFPDDCEYIRVSQCTTGRVYVLKFKSSNRRFFFWLQEPRADKDEEHCKKINDYLNNPPGPGANSSSGGSGSGSGSGLTGADQDLTSILNSMSQTQLLQLFGNVGSMGLGNLINSMRRKGMSRRSVERILMSLVRSRPSTGSSRSSSANASTPIVPRITTTVPSTPNNSSTGAGVTVTPPNSASVVPGTPDAPKRGSRNGSNGGNAGATSGTAGNPIQLADLQNLLQEMTPPPEQPQVDLSQALTSDTLTGILNDSDALSQLQEHLPAVEGDSQEQLRSTLQSPQFRQAVSMFSSALQSGQLAPVVAQLAVNPEAVNAASHGDMQGFVEALEKGSAEASKSKEDNAAGKSKDDTESSKDGKKKDDDDGMQLD